MPDNVIFNSSLTWDSPLFDDEPVIHSPVAVFEAAVQHWAERELSMGTDEANIKKAAHALLHGGSVIDLAGLHLRSLPDVTLPSGVLRLDLSDNPQLTAIPASFLNQSPFLCVVIDNTALSSETLRFFEARLGNKLFHYEQQATDGAESQARFFYPELFITDVAENPFDDTAREYANPLSGVASDPAAGDETVDTAHERAEYEQVYASPVHSGADVDSYASSVPPDETRSPSGIEQDLLPPEHRAWLKRNVDDKVPAGKVKLKTYATLLENTKPWPAGLKLKHVANHYRLNFSSLSKTFNEIRWTKASLRELLDANRRWLDQKLSEPLARSKHKVKTLATLCLAHKPYPAGLKEVHIARYYNVPQASLNTAIKRIKSPDTWPPLSREKRAWFASHWDDKVPQNAGKMKAVVALFQAYKSLPLRISRKDIARYYNVKITTLDSAIQRFRLQQRQFPQSNATRAWLEQNWSPKLPDIKRKREKARALAILFLADNTRPEDLTKRQIAGYYDVSYSSFVTALWRENKTTGTAMDAD